MAEEDIAEIGLVGSPADNVRRLAKLTAETGLDGVVCSPKEIELLRGEFANDFTLVTPGIRPEWAAKGDQRRVTTPVEALQLGATQLVIGRPVTGAPDPLESLSRIESEIRKA